MAYPEGFTFQAGPYASPIPPPLGDDAEQIGQLEAIDDKLRDAVALLVGANAFPALVDHAREVLRDIPVSIARIRERALDAAA